MVCLELVLRLASQRSSHEETQTNTVERGCWSCSNNNNKKDGEREAGVNPPAALSGSACELKASQSGARAGGLGSVGSSPHDICALTLHERFTAACLRAGGAGGPGLDRSTFRSSHSLSCNLPAAGRRTHARAHTSVCFLAAD